MKYKYWLKDKLYGFPAYIQHCDYAVDNFGCADESDAIYKGYARIRIEDKILYCDFNKDTFKHKQDLINFINSNLPCAVDKICLNIFKEVEDYKEFDSFDKSGISLFINSSRRNNMIKSAWLIDKRGNRITDEQAAEIVRRNRSEIEDLENRMRSRSKADNFRDGSRLHDLKAENDYYESILEHVEGRKIMNNGEIKSGYERNAQTLKALFSSADVNEKDRRWFEQTIENWNRSSNKDLNITYTILDYENCEAVFSFTPLYHKNITRYGKLMMENGWYYLSIYSDPDLNNVIEENKGTDNWHLTEDFKHAYWFINDRPQPMGWY